LIKVKQEVPLLLYRYILRWSWVYASSYAWVIVLQDLGRV
jgi:hypothetical protein